MKRYVCAILLFALLTTLALPAGAGNRAGSSCTFVYQGADYTANSPLIINRDGEIKVTFLVNDAKQKHSFFREILLTEYNFINPTLNQYTELENKMSVVIYPPTTPYATLVTSFLSEKGGTVLEAEDVTVTTLFVPNRIKYITSKVEPELYLLHIEVLPGTPGMAASTEEKLFCRSTTVFDIYFYTENERLYILGLFLSSIPYEVRNGQICFSTDSEFVLETPTPTPTPTVRPTPKPTPSPTPKSTVRPTAKPTVAVTAAPEECDICHGTGDCNFCHGTRRCHICGGSGKSFFGGMDCVGCIRGKCTYCHTGKCTACGGTGRQKK